MNTKIRDERERAMLDAEQTLRETKIADLLSAAYSLTHRMHYTKTAAQAQRRAGERAAAQELEADWQTLRAQRNMIDAEIERRCES